ncbi:L-type lectin-domain containing receptor kinase IX.1-like [Iris pallida]|uniref:non-specific serine/threonine protein kinase n=1 Tax=Iris pallida TaxID=29817 RepID=A0AAX6DKT2_IRIPA|nr:L-type lectin-domain containing receptor kinase IX.1-like [Iris pallida]
MRTLVFFFLLLLPFPFAAPLSFNFSGFDQNTPSFIDFQGDAFLNRVIRLTKNELGAPITSSAGRAVYKTPLLLWDSETGEVTDFATHFSFIIDAFNQSSYGDGLTFFLSPYPSAVPPSSSGAFLGLLNQAAAFDVLNNKVVAVEFDTFKNDWDPSDDHVGINVNSIKSAASVPWKSSIKDGRRANAWVSYNASAKNLSVFLTYADNPIFGGNSSLSYVVDLKEVLPEQVAIGFSASTGFVTEIHNILSWDFRSNLVARKKKKSKIWLIILVASVVAVVLVLGLLWFILYRARRLAKEKELFDNDVSIDDEFEKGRGPKRFLYSDLVAATKKFAKERKLGEGGFGEVYKGFLTQGNLEVAIKKVSADSKQGKKEYISEVKIISRLRHRNLVQLVGWCHENGEFLLVYEFMPNGSLDTHLYSQKKVLPWPVRYKIALGLASGLLYLHEEWEQCVVHRDIKPSNVMLDSIFNAKLGDFGLARFVDHDIGSQTTMLAGTMGYLAPESVTTGRASKESDVYSFGALALELACGRRPVDRQEIDDRIVLVDWVWDLYGRGRILDAADKRLNNEFDTKEMEMLMVAGLWCAHPDHHARPSIRQVINVLKLEAPLPNLPPQMPVAMYFSPPVDLSKFTVTTTYTTETSSPNTSTFSSPATASRSSIVSNPSSGSLFSKSSRKMAR